MRNYSELVYLCRDFVRYLSGTDYFRQPQGLGRYFSDRRCYYNDLTGKADWRGKYIDGVPVLYFPSTRTTAVSPCTVLLFAIGSLDRYFLEGGEVYLTAVRNAYRWLVRNMHAGGYWEELLIGQHASDFYSTNSGMNQGLALSFLSRLSTERVFSSENESIVKLMHAVADNMTKPVEDSGTLAIDGQDVYICEYCTRDKSVALNGWIYGVFGLLDFVRLMDDRNKRALLDTTVATMARALSEFHLANGWMYYDNRGRTCSPFYADLHVHLLDAMHRLFGTPAFLESKIRCERANTRRNRIRFTVAKIAEKLRSTPTYGTA